MISTRMRLMSAVVGVFLTAGCSAPKLDGGNYVTPLHGADVTENPTQYSESLACMRELIPGAKRNAVAFAVGQIADATGKNEYYTGRPITQGASLMVMSALQKAGLRQVERFDTAVAELELEYANNKLIADQRTGYRQILAGSVAGSDFFIVGGITELNFNIHSSSADLLVGPVTLGGRYFVMNVGADLRLVNSRTLEVVDVVSYQRQMFGREISAGVFEFIGSQPFDLGIGSRSQEPVHLAVRAVLERGVMDLVSNLYGVNATGCLPSAEETS